VFVAGGAVMLVLADAIGRRSPWWRAEDFNTDSSLFSPSVPVVDRRRCMATLG
jgi:hypothetical protein